MSVAALQSLPLYVKYLLTGLIGMVPIIELRGGIPIGVFTFGLNYVQAFACAFIGNIIPVYFIVKYIKVIFKFLSRWKPFEKLINVITEKANKKIAESKHLERAVFLGVYLFVAIPLPGTGAWTGSLIAALLDLKPKKCIVPIFLGVLTAGIIVLALTAGAKGGIEYLFQSNLTQ